VLAALGVLSLALGAYAALRLGVNADPNAMVSEDLPFRIHEREFQAAFRAASDEFLVLVDGESASAAGRAAEALAERLRAQPELFERAIVVGGGEFFDRNALLYLELPELEEFVDRLAAVQPFLAEVARDPSVVGLSDLLRRALAAKREGESLGMDLGGVFDRLSAATEAAEAGRAAPDPWGDALIGGEISESARFRVVSAIARRSFGELLNAEPVLEALRAETKALAASDVGAGVGFRLTGTEVLNYEELQTVSVEGRVVGVVSLALFTFAVYFALRSAGVVAAQVGALVASLLWTNAFAAAAIGELNQVSAVFNVLVVGLGGELGIHFCLRYAELAESGLSRAEALVETARSIGSSLFSSAGTTSIGFLVFLPTDYRGVAELGLISGAGVLLSLVATLTVLPALLALVPAPRPRPVRAWLRRLELLPVRWSRPVRWSALALGLGAALLVPRMRFDHNPIHLRDPESPAVQAFRDLVARSEVTPWAIDVVAPDLASAEALAERIAALPPVERAITAADFVPDDQDEKRAVLADALMFLPPEPPPARRPSGAAQLEALERLEAALAAGDGHGDARLRASEERLAAALRRFREGPGRGAPDGALARLQANVVGTLPEQLSDLAVSLAPERVTLESLPPDLREQVLATDGRARIQVFPKKDVFVGQNLDEFMDAVTAVAPNGTGSAVNLVSWGEVTSGAMKQALSVGLVCMFAFLFLLWRNLWDSVLAFFPLALASLLCIGVMQLLGMPFNFANVIVLPMLIGMGIDNGVHLVHRHRTNPAEVDVLGTSTARAVFFAALTTVLCFGSLGFASHRGMAAIGRMLTLGVAATLVCYVVVLPAVLAWDDERRRRR